MMKSELHLLVALVSHTGRVYSRNEFLKSKESELAKQIGILSDMKVILYNMDDIRTVDLKISKYEKGTDIKIERSMGE